MDPCTRARPFPTTVFWYSPTRRMRRHLRSTIVVLATVLAAQYALAVVCELSCAPAVPRAAAEHASVPGCHASATEAGDGTARLASAGLTHCDFRHVGPVVTVAVERQHDGRMQGHRSLGPSPATSYGEAGLARRATGPPTRDPAAPAPHRLLIPLRI